DDLTRTWFACCQHETRKPDALMAGERGKRPVVECPSHRPTHRKPNRAANAKLQANVFGGDNASRGVSWWPASLTTQQPKGKALNSDDASLQSTVIPGSQGPHVQVL
ncbi:hypothetical protein QJQ45_018868, partial [Haematococcus lacustris]